MIGRRNIIKRAFMVLVNASVTFIISIFLPAATLYYLNGWIFIGVTLAMLLIFGVNFKKTNPLVLELRLAGEEKNSLQRWIVRLSGVLMICCLSMSSLGYNLGVCNIKWLPIIGIPLYITSFGLYVSVARQNAYLMRHIGVSKGQIVVRTGIYGIIRHPLYLAVFLMSVSVPLILGSLLGYIPVILFLVLLIIRITDEEAYLCENLNGYKQYMEDVKYRFIPLIW